MKLNEHPELLKVGDLVTSDFRTGEEDVVRMIIEIRKEQSFACGLTAWADGGLACSECGRTFAYPVSGVDAAWFIPVKES